MTGRRIAILENTEVACFGTAVLAGVGAGVFSDVTSACQKNVRIKRRYEPGTADYTECYENFCKAEGKIL